MEKKFRQTVYQFQQFEPSKWSARFDYIDATWDEVNAGYCQKGEILKIDGFFYIYRGAFYYDLVEGRPSIIRFRKRGKIIKEVNA